MQKNAPFALYKGDAADAALLYKNVVYNDTLGAKRYKRENQSYLVGFSLPNFHQSTITIINNKQQTTNQQTTNQQTTNNQQPTTNNKQQKHATHRPK